MSEKIKPEWLHLYPGAWWHDDGAIVGTREGLAELRDALEIALRDGNAVARAFVADGEGYCIYVHQVTDDDMAKMATPYTDEMAAESEDSDALRPHQLEHRAEEAYREKFLRPTPELSRAVGVGLNEISKEQNMTDTKSLRTGAGYALGVGLYATHGAMTEAADTIDTLRAQLAEAQEDEKRLDWLEAQVNKNGELHLHDGNHARGIGIGLRPGTLVRTLRAAIDAARGESNA